MSMDEIYNIPGAMAQAIATQHHAQSVADAINREADLQEQLAKANSRIRELEALLHAQKYSADAINEAKTKKSLDKIESNFIDRAISDLRQRAAEIERLNAALALSEQRASSLQLIIDNNKAELEQLRSIVADVNRGKA